MFGRDEKKDASSTALRWRISNECSEEFIHRHDSNSFMDTLIPAFFHNQIIIRF